MRIGAISALALALLALVSHGWPSAEATQSSISGVVWSDTNADGIRQPDEPGVRMGLVLIGPGGERQGVSNEDGSYTFGGLEPGPYTVRLTFAQGTSYLTHPARLGTGPYQTGVTVGAESVVGLDFGLHQTLSVPMFAGLTWVDASLDREPRVRALIDGVDCTGPSGIRAADAGFTYQISVASAAILPSCGEAGDTIVFMVDGRRANETATWQAVEVPAFGPNATGTVVPAPAILPPGQLPPPGAPPPLHANRRILDLTVGSRPAVFSIAIVDEVGDLVVGPRLRAQAFVDGHVCGQVEGIGLGGLLIAVPPRDIKPGCGYEGAAVSFTVDDTLAPETALWFPTRAELRLTLTASASSPTAGPRISPPDVGEAGLR